MSNFTSNSVLSNNDMLTETLRGFLEAILFVSEDVQDMGIIDFVDSDINDIFTNYIDVFVNMVDASSVLMDEAENHGFEQLGRDMYFDLIGAGVGLWEQKETSNLNKLWEAIRNTKVVEEFEVFKNGDKVGISI
ncbi:hypothetical protein VPDG_00144 [Vibrio phage henriette 12B8]|uniref:hypothetical protein n=1 Tax=Vibrio phage henriette 12B8 TaxID=573174 RepID=UPI0002C06DBC|nr:hypothetical protein VPDG_00144 [Vibrio phage henriette 12B8]AGG58305.1 hypothetical protein VPDG_00144 [Vibrio phage henriette 12B8]